MSKRATQMIVFGAFLGLCGVLGWAATGFAWKAKTAILSGAMCGSLMVGCGLLLFRGRGWRASIGDAGGTFLPLVFCGVFTWRAVIAWGDWSGGEPKLAVAALLTLMALVSLVTFANLFQPWRKSWIKAISAKSARPAA